jgi:hypothetical protein
MAGINQAMTKEQILIMHSVSLILQNCGNSYINAYTEKWLKHAKSIGAYHGDVTGDRGEVHQAWQGWLDYNGGLPDLPEYN